MKNKKFYYLVRVSYLGFRYSGWQKQPGYKTIEGMLTRTIKFVLGEERSFKILGAGRTDAKVSSIDGAFELFIDHEPLENLDQLLNAFNLNLPADIRIESIEEVANKFNIIHSAKEKTYCYLFSFGSKAHPFCAPIMANYPEQLNITLMQEAAKLFVGTHDFKNFTARKDKKKSQTLRTISSCELKLNTTIVASFFPKDSYVLEVRGKGFLRYQIRLMMGALVCLGRNEIDLDGLKKMLNSDLDDFIPYVAAGSGLHLKELLFDNSLYNKS
jgi:tRNA pseudouridine38-40 synthase